MAGVVRDHGPPGEGPRAEADNGEEFDKGASIEAHGEDSGEGAHVRPHDDLLEVADVS